MTKEYPNLTEKELVISRKVVELLKGEGITMDEAEKILEKIIHSSCPECGKTTWETMKEHKLKHKVGFE